MKYRLALDIGATRTTIGLIDLDQPHVVTSDRPYSEVLFTGRRSAVHALVDAIRRFLASSGISLADVVGVGVGVPGTADRERGTVLQCPNLHALDGAPLGPGGSEELGIPVYVDNNTNLISLGEHLAGAGQGVDDMACVFVGTGVGCGLILGGELYEGADGTAGELGHTIVVRDGLLCTCGSRGCVEMYCSGKALTLVAEQVFQPGELYTLGSRYEGASLLIEQAHHGHPTALRALERAFEHLGIALANMVNLLNPRLLVLGGGIVFAWPQGVEVAREVVMREALPGPRRNLRIEISLLRNFAGVLGGAILVSRHGQVHSPRGH